MRLIKNTSNEGWDLIGPAQLMGNKKTKNGDQAEKDNNGRQLGGEKATDEVMIK